MSAHNFHMDTPLSKCDAVAQALQDKIIKGEYKTGDQLPPEAALCEMFGVSRITVRESLKKLSMMGIVSIRQGKGTFVNNVDLGLFMKPMFQLIDFDELNIDCIYDARFYIESGTARLAAVNRTAEDVAALSEILDKLDAAIREADLAGLGRFDPMFHIRVAEAAKNPLLRAVVVTLEDISSTCQKRLDKYDVFLGSAQEQHTAIFEAIRAGDPDRAEEMMRLHTIASKEVLKFS